MGVRNKKFSMGNFIQIEFLWFFFGLSRIRTYVGKPDGFTIRFLRPLGHQPILI